MLFRRNNNAERILRARVRNSGQALDVYGALLDDLELASIDDGARVIQYTPHGGANQQWLLRPVDSTAAPVTTASER